jgi:outer membrane receptor protein involved in Fe transport
MGRWLFLIIALCLLAPGARAFGQAQNTGSILGSVNDPSGAVIPGAKVTAIEPSTGFNRSVVTNKAGEFTLPDIPVGTYLITVTAGDNFDTYQQDGVVIDADKAVKIVAKMTVGSKSETVTVSSQGIGVDNSTIKTIIDTELVQNLPIDGNNTVALAGLLPGVTDLNAPATNTSDRGGPTYSVSGSRNTQNLMLFDGLMWNNLFFNTGINYPPALGLQEISVLLNNFKAQYGRNAGSVFNVVTKRGSNQIHGAAWDYIQNKIFNATDYLSGKNPDDTSNQFGFTVGGPIKRDKLYYQLTVQYLIQNLQVIGTSQVPDAAERGLLAVCPDGSIDTFGCANGATPKISARPCQTGSNGQQVWPGDSCAGFADDLHQVNTATSNTVYKKLTNPEQITGSSGGAIPAGAEANFNSAWYQSGHTGTSPCIGLLTQAESYAAANTYLDGTSQPTYLPTGEVPQECLNPVLMNYKGVYGSNNGVLATYVPLPNAGIIASTAYLGVVPGVVTAAPQPRHDLNLLGRVDYIINSRHSIDVRYNLINANDATASGVNSASAGIATYELSSNSAVSNFGNIGETWVVTPNIVNVLRVGYKRYVTASPPQDHSTWNAFGGNFVEPGIPTMPVVKTSDFTLGSLSQSNHNVVNENIEILEQLSWTHGNHNFQFGANALRLQYLNRTDYPGQIAFSTGYTSDTLADLAIGTPSTVDANSLLVQGGISNSIFGYMQDDWRASSRLTLNLGVRYELPFQWYQPNGYASTFVPGHQSTVFPGAIGGLAFPGDGGVLKSLVPTDFNGVVPRIGFAWDVFGTGRLAFRGGFGMFFDAINANVIGVGEPFYFQLHKLLPPGGASAPLATFGSNLTDTTPNGNNYVVPAGFNKANPQFLAPYTLFYPDRNFRTPYYEAFNFGFQLRVTHGGVLEVNYVGKLGRKQTIPYDQNPAIVDCTGGYNAANPTLYGSPYCSTLYGTPTTSNGTASATSASEQARLRYTPFNGGGTGLVDFASLGSSYYDGLQVQYTQRGGRNLTILASYAYSKSIDFQTQSQSLSNTIPNVFNISSERGLSDFDARHILNMGWVYNLPNVTSGPHFLRTALSGYVYGGKFSGHTGRPFSVTINNDTALDDEPNQRAALMPGVSPYLPKNRHRNCPAAVGSCKVQEWFNINAFTYPTIGTFSPMKRNSLIGPGYLDTDMNFGRYFALSKIREGMRMLLRADAFNVWNTPNLAQPSASFGCSSTSIQQPGNKNYGLYCTNALVSGTAGTSSATYGTLASASFGTIGSTFGNNGNTSTNGRKMQFNVTVYF